MDPSETTTTITTSSSSPPPKTLIPCAACKILRRRCGEKCILAPYFPPTHPLHFTTAHRIFGASNIIKLLQEMPESRRADAVSSMVYEANARMRDPVYGCAGLIWHLQRQVIELEAQLAKARAELADVQVQHASLLAAVCMDLGKMVQPHQTTSSQLMLDEQYIGFLEEYDDQCHGAIWT